MDQHSQFDPKGTTPELTCSEFDGLLSDAIDGLLTVAAQRRFDAHRQLCPTCGPLFAETSAGMKWLNVLEEVEPPANLLHNILAATTMQTVAATAPIQKLTWKQRLSGIFADLAAPMRAVVRQPRMAMTSAMAVFSLMLSLNFAGVKVSDLRHVNLRPSAIKESATMKYYETSSRVVKYYENIRLVYEVESRLQELKRVTNTEDQERPPAERNDRKKSDNLKPDRERQQNYYSMERQNMLLAKWSTSELNNGSNLLCFAAGRVAAGKDQDTHRTDESFVITGLTRGWKPGKFTSDANRRRLAFGTKSGRSLLA